MNLAKMDKVMYRIGLACLIVAAGCFGWCQDCVIKKDD